MWLVNNVIYNTVTIVSCGFFPTQRGTEQQQIWIIWIEGCSFSHFNISEFVIVLARWKAVQTAIVHAYTNLVIVAYIVTHAMNCALLVLHAKLYNWRQNKGQNSSKSIKDISKQQGASMTDISINHVILSLREKTLVCQKLDTDIE